MRLIYPKFEKLMSSYLENGFKEDEFRINFIDIQDDHKCAIAEVDIIEYAKSMDGTFHLSALTNSRIIQQMGIIFSCHIMQSEKDREIYFLRDSWKFKKIVSKLEKIQYKHNNITIRRGNEQTIIGCEIDVEEGSFLGKIMWLIPNKPYEIFDK